MGIERDQLHALRESVVPGKVVMIFGPRRVGKPELVRRFLESKSSYLSISGEDLFAREALE